MYIQVPPFTSGPQILDPKMLANMGLDPKNPNSTILAAMAAMDPTGQQIAAMY